MKINLSPTFIQSYQFDSLDKEQFLVVVVEAVLQLDWNLFYVNDIGILAYTKISFKSWSEEVIFKIDAGVVNIKSSCTTSQFIDWGKNKSNVEAVVRKIDEVKRQLTIEEINARLVKLQSKYSLFDADLVRKFDIKSWC